MKLGTAKVANIVVTYQKGIHLLLHLIKNLKKTCYRTDNGWPMISGSGHEEVPWHISHADPIYGAAVAGSAQNFPQVDKYFTSSVPALLHINQNSQGSSSGPKSGKVLPSVA